MVANLLKKRAIVDLRAENLAGDPAGRPAKSTTVWPTGRLGGQPVGRSV